MAGWHFLCLTGFQLWVIRRATLLLGESYGDFAHPFAIASFASAFTLIGLQQTVLRYTGFHAAQGQWGAVKRILLQGVAMRGGLLLAVSLGLFFHLSATNPTSRQTAAMVCLYLIAQGLFLLLAAALQGMDRFRELAGSSTLMLLATALPAKSLTGIFSMLALGYGTAAASLAAIATWTLWRRGNENQPQEAVEGVAPPVFRHLLRFSTLLSLGALFTLGSDSSPILLLRDAYPAVTYGLLALAFQLSLYPPRVNALAESLILPPMSALAQSGGAERQLSLLAAWVKRLRLMGVLVLAPLPLLLPTVLHRVFEVDHPQATLFISLMLLANLPRFLLPATSAALIARGKPLLLSVGSGAKLALDLALLLSLRGGNPIVLILALVGSALVFGQAIFALAHRELGGRLRLDGWTILAVSLGAATLLMEAEAWVMPTAWTVAAGLLGRALFRRPLR